MKTKLKFIFLFVLTFAFNNVFSNIDSLKKVLQTKDFGEVKRYLQDYKKSPNHYSAFTYSENLVDSYYAISLQFQSVDKFDSIQNLKSNLYTVNILSNQYKIVHYSIKDFGLVNFNKEQIDIKQINEFEYTDSMAYAKFSRRKKIRGETRREEIENLFPKDFAYGFLFGLGFAGQENKQRLWMHEHVDNKDSNALFSWLISPSMALKIYAVEGFYKLKKNGMKITYQQWQAIQYIKDSKAGVRIVYGCIISQETAKKLCRKYRFRKPKKKT
jgi:hypothetical protein